MNYLHKLTGSFAALFLNAAFLFAQQVDIGLSNYYSDALNGNATAYGEIYDRNQYTASHRTYPKGTLLKVSRLDNGKSVIVRVNDRGPFSSDGAIISLSMAAAAMIDLTLVGHAQVKVEQFGYSETNATATQYNTVNNQASNAYAFDRIFNGAPQEAPQEYFTARGTNGNNATYGNNGTNSQNGAQTQQYGPVPPSYDRRYQNQNNNGYNVPNNGSSQVPPEYNFTGSSNNTYLPYNNPNIPNSYSTNSSSGTPNVNWNSAQGPNHIEGIPTLAPGSGFSVQVGSYTQLDNATRQAQSLRNLGLSEIYLGQGAATNGTRIYKLYAGRFDNRDSASVYASQIKRQFLVNGFVLRL